MRRSRSRRDQGKRPSRREREPRGRFDAAADEPPARGRGRRRGGSGKKGRGGEGGFDWSVADGEESYDDRDDYDDDEPRSRRRREPETTMRRSRRSRGRERLTLMELCTGVLGYAVILPRKPGESQPAYRQFRDQVIEALQKIEADAPEHGIDPEDARHAAYALCFFMDGQVLESEWEGKAQWSMEPLGIVRQQDPEGGVNFFRRLEAFTDRQKAVKEIYLVCLSLGFRGQLAELEPAQQAARLAELKKELWRGLGHPPIDKQAELFPDAYERADPIEDEVPPPPRWWMFASLGAVVLVIGVWVLLYFVAGNSPRAAEAVVSGEVERVREAPAPIQPQQPPAPEATQPTEEDGS